MNTNIIKSNKLVLLVIIALMAITLLPLNTMIAYAAPEDNVTVEYRYTEGDTVVIPPTITRLGREYRLLSRAEPVLESSLPQVRTYNYRINGALTAAELAIVQSASPDLSITPVDIVKEREVDKTKILSGRPNNDVDSIPLEDTFEVTSATAASGKEMIKLHRAGIEFEVESWEIPGELPGTYKATVVYRGIETYSELGYYLAETTYQSQVTEGETKTFIIVAIYEPTDLDQEAAPVIAGPTTTEIPTPDPPEAPAEFTEEQLALLESQIPLSAGDPLAPLKNIVDGLTPLGGFGVTSAWSVVSMLMSFVAVALGITKGAGMIVGRKKNKAATLAGNDQSPAKTKGLLKILAIIFGALTPVTWLFVDNLSQPQVWINKGTMFVGAIFVVNLVLFIVSTSKKDKAKQQAEVATEAPAEQSAQAAPAEQAGSPDNNSAA